MNIQLQQLIDLQKIDLEIADLQKFKAMIPGQIESSKVDLEGEKRHLNEVEEVMDSLHKEHKKLEMDVQAETDHMGKTKAKLPVVKTNKEYSAILVEVEAIKVKVSKAEDRQLEIMEALEEKEKEIPPLQALYKEHENKFQEYKAQKEAEAKRGEQELETISAKRKEIVGRLEPKWMRQYEKISEFRGNLAVVLLQENVCQGCFQQVLPQVVIDVKHGDEIKQCENCSRFLYWIKESQTETAVPK